MRDGPSRPRGGIACRVVDQGLGAGGQAPLGIEVVHAFDLFGHRAAAGAQHVRVVPRPDLAEGPVEVRHPVALTTADVDGREDQREAHVLRAAVLDQARLAGLEEPGIVLSHHADERGGLLPGQPCGQHAVADRSGELEAALRGGELRPGPDGAGPVLLPHLVRRVPGALRAARAQVLETVRLEVGVLVAAEVVPALDEPVVVLLPGEERGHVPDVLHADVQHRLRRQRDQELLDEPVAVDRGDVGLRQRTLRVEW